MGVDVGATEAKHTLESYLQLLRGNKPYFYLWLGEVGKPHMMHSAEPMTCDHAHLRGAQLRKVMLMGTGSADACMVF